MALNQMGLGFLITAKDTASAVFRKAGKNLGLLDKSGSMVSQRFTEIGGKMRYAGVRMMGAGVAIGAGLGYAIKQAAAFDKKIAEVTTLTDEATFPAERMKDLTRDLAGAYGLPAIEQAGALYQTISAGVTDAAEATKLMDSANKLAIGGVTDITTSVDLLTSAVNAYAASGLTAEEASDALFVGIKYGKTTADELGMSLGRVTPIAAAMGIKYDEVVASLAAITTQGIKTRQATTGLKAAMANIIRPTAEAQKEADRLGVTWGIEGVKAAGGFKQLLDKVTSSSEFNEDSLRKLFPAIEGLNVIMALSANEGAKFNEVLAAMGGKTGATDTAFGKMSETFSFAAGQLKAQLLVAISSLGEALAPLIKAITVVISAIVKGFNMLPKPVKTVIAGFLAFGAVALVLVGGLLIVGGAIASMVASAGALIAALKIIALVASGAVLALLPLIAIGAGLYMVWKNNIGGIRDSVMDFFGKVKIAFKALSELFTEGKMSAATWAEFNKAGDGVKDFVTKIWTAYHRIKAFLEGLADGFEGALIEAQPSIDAFKEAIGGLVDAFAPIVEGPEESKKAFDEAGKSGESLGKVLGKAFQLITDVITPFIETLTGLKQGWDAATSSGTTLGRVVKTISDAISEIAEAFTGSKESTDEGTSGWQTFGQAVGYVVGGVVNAIGLLIGVFAAVGSVVAGVVGAIRAAFSGVANIVGSVVDLITSIFTGQWSEAWTAAKQVVVDIVNAIMATVGAMVGGIASAVDKLGSVVGVDLGLGKQYEYMTAKTQVDLAKKMGVEAPGAAVAGITVRRGIAPPVAPPTAAPPAAAPAGAGAGIMGAFTEAMRSMAAAPQPVTVDYKAKTEVTLDGSKLAEIIQQKVEELEARRGET